MTGSIVSVADEAPAMFVNIVPPSLETCHWIVATEHPGGTGPWATVNDAEPPAAPAEAFCGCVAIDGGCEHVPDMGNTVNLAARVLAEPAALVRAARNCSPDCDTDVGSIVSVSPVAPDAFVNVAPPSIDSCHCTAGSAHPGCVVIVTVNVAGSGAVTVTSFGPETV